MMIDLYSRSGRARFGVVDRAIASVHDQPQATNLGYDVTNRVLLRLGDALSRLAIGIDASQHRSAITGHQEQGTRWLTRAKVMSLMFASRMCLEHPPSLKGVLIDWCLSSNRMQIVAIATNNDEHPWYRKS